MQFLSLEIKRNQWGKEVGQLTGEIQFNSPSSKVALRINEATALKLLQIVQEGLVDAAREVAEIIPASITEAINARDKVLELE